MKKYKKLWSERWHVSSRFIRFLIFNLWFLTNLRTQRTTLTRKLYDKYRSRGKQVLKLLRVSDRVYPCGRRVEFTHRFPCMSYEATKRGPVLIAACVIVYCVRHGTTPASCWTSTVYGETAEIRSKRCLHFQTYRAQSLLNPIFIWCDVLLNGSHHSSVVSIPLLLPSSSSTLREINVRDDDIRTQRKVLSYRQ